MVASCLHLLCPFERQMAALVVKIELFDLFMLGFVLRFPYVLEIWVVKTLFYSEALGLIYGLVREIGG